MSTIIICRCCMLEQELPEGAGLLECPACGTRNSRPQATGSSLEVFQRAIRQRMRCDFHNAENSYQHVLLDYPEEHEALWGLALCRYGVEYVEDPKKRRPMPVVHTTRRKPMQEDPDFLQACELAPEEIRRQYEADAEYIDQAQAEIRKLAETCPPFDVFLCHKTTVLDGYGYTEDYSRGMKLYHRLKERGYRVFFAPEAMEGVAAGADYEAGIYHALCTAKVMLVICSRADHLNSAWVQNEWQRYLEMADETDDHALVPLLYADMRASALPRAFRVRKLQGIRMGEIDSWEMTLKAVAKYAGDPAKTAAPVQPVPFAPVQPPVQQPAPVQPPVQKPVPVPVQPPAQKPVPTPAPAPKVVTEGDYRIRVNAAGDGCAIEAYTGRENRVVVPEKLGEWPVQGVWRNAFRPEQGVTAIELPATVRYIPGGAFTDIPGLMLHVQAGSPAHHYAQKAGLDCRTEPLPPPSMEADFYTGFDPDGCVINGYLGTDREVIVPRIIHGKQVARIGVSAFPPEAQIIRLPVGLKSIAGMAFSSCRELREVEIPASVVAIGGYAFPDPSRLTLRVQQGSFAYRYAKKNGIRIAGESDEEPVQVQEAPQLFEAPVQEAPQAPAAPAQDAQRQQALEELTALLQLRAVQLAQRENAPVQDARFTLIQEKDGCVIEMYTGTDRRVVVPPEIGGRVVLRLEAKAFMRDDVRIEAVTLPEGMEQIGAWGLANCPRLEEVRLPSTLRVVDDCAFENCQRLWSITLPENLEVIGDQAFSGCEELRELTIPAGVQTIGSYAFHDCQSLILTVTKDSPAHAYALEHGIAFRTSGDEPVQQAPVAAAASEADFDTMDRDEICAIRRYTGPGGSVVIPSSIRGRRVEGVWNGAFADVAGLTSIELPATVRHIGDTAFSGIPGLRLRVYAGSAALEYAISHALAHEIIYEARDVFRTRSVKGGCAITGYTGPGGFVMVPDSIDGVPVVSIGERAFADRDVITEVVLPGGIVSIGTRAFVNDSMLRTIRLPEGLVSIGYEAFRCCGSLTDLTLPQSLREIGEQAFVSAGFEQLQLPEGLKEIGDQAFCHSRLRAIRLPQGLEKLGTAALAYCDALQEVQLPASMERIPERLFEGCGALEDVTLPARAKLLGRSAFKGCAQLAYAELPEDLTTIAESAFTGCSALRRITIPAGVRELADHLFSGCAMLEKVVLPAGLTKVGTGAFENCSHLNMTELPAGVTDMGERAFRGCTSLTAFTLPAGVIRLNRGMFMECSGLQEITLPQGLIAVGEQSFMRCGLQRLNMPDSMRAIGKSAFYACDALREIRFSPSLQHIAEAAFRFCSALTRVMLPEGVTGIAAGAFADCPALAEAVLPRGLTLVNDNLFARCAGLRSVTLPDGVTAIGVSAFEGCSSLRSLPLPGKLAIIGEKAFYASGLQEISIPVQVKTLEEFTFSRCKDLTAVILPYGLHTIRDGAFEGCENLARINLPDGMLKIGKSVFFDCPKLPSAIRKRSPGSLMGFVRKFLG